MTKKVYVFLLIIFLLGTALRFYKLGLIPLGFHTDEAYLGYNAYSILKTGSEITGGFLPIHFKSFLYSPAGYSYFSIPFIILFGLNEFSVRFAAALFGSLTILTTFLLTNKLFSKFKNSETIAIFAAFFIAISPWNINLSRVSTENVIVVFFISLGIWLFLLWNEKNKFYLLILSYLSLLITLLTYQAPRSFLPLFIPILLVVTLFANKKSGVKKFFSPIALYILLIIIPVALIILSPTLSFRLRTLSIFQNPQTQLVLNEELREDGVMNVPPQIARVFHNKILNYSTTFAQNYFQHFSYSFLFTDQGLPARYRVPDMGILYFFDIPLLFLGIWSLFRNDKKLGVLILGWVALAPVGSALTFDDVPNLQRTLIIFPALSIISALGLCEIYNFFTSFKNKWVFRFAMFCVAVVIAYSLSFYLYSYYVQQVVHRPWFREEGYRELVSTLNKYTLKYKKVVISDSYGSPSMFIFFYNSYDPKIVQNILKKNTIGQDYGSVSFDKYHISKDGCPLRAYQDTDKKTGILVTKLVGEKGILYVDDGQCETPSEGVEKIAIIKRSDNTAAFKVMSITK